MAIIPATIDLNPAGNDPEASVIWLHGLGANGNDFVPIVEQFDLLEGLKVRFVFPHAPFRTITVNSGMKMRAWYDIFEIDLSAKEDEIGIQESATLINLLIEREKKLGVPANRIVLGGFSQGGAISLYAGLRYAEKLGGIIALSTYLPLLKKLEEERKAANQNIPIFMAHGLFDPVVPLMLGQATKQHLQDLGYTIHWHSYSMPHTVTPEEIKDIGSFLGQVL